MQADSHPNSSTKVPDTSINFETAHSKRNRMGHLTLILQLLCEIIPVADRVNVYLFLLSRWKDDVVQKLISETIHGGGATRNKITLVVENNHLTWYVLRRLSSRKGWIFSLKWINSFLQKKKKVFWSIKNMVPANVIKNIHAASCFVVSPRCCTEWVKSAVL